MIDPNDNMISHDRDNRLTKILQKLPVEDGRHICRLINRDPLTDIYWMLLVIYGFVLSGFLLWPFDFDAYVKNDNRWVKGSGGIEFPGTGQAVSISPSQEFFNRMTKGNGLTLELWIETQDLKQSGPARILTYSSNTGERNFTVGQSYDQLVVRLRTTETSLNGTNPHLIIEDTFNDQSMQHLVVTYDFYEQRVYLNGEQKKRSKVLKGGFSNWDPSCRLGAGNEVTGNRPWKGKIYYAAVFNRPLAELEIHHNYHAGLQSEFNKLGAGNNRVIAETQVARYLFDEGEGATIHDSGSGLSPADLFIPKYIWRGNSPLLDFSRGYFKSNSWFSDVVINIMIFIPLGFFLHGILRVRYGLTSKVSLAALLAGALLTLGVESLQHFSLTRSSSLIDVTTNVAGTALGIAIDKAYNLYLNHRAKGLQSLCFSIKGNNN